MAGQVTRWMQHGACIGLMAIVAVACAVGVGLPATDAAEQIVEYRQVDPLGGPGADRTDV